MLTKEGGERIKHIPDDRKTTKIFQNRIAKKDQRVDGLARTGLDVFVLLQPIHMQSWLRTQKKPYLGERKGRFHQGNQ